MSIVTVTYIATVVFYFLEHILNSDILQNCSSGEKSSDQNDIRKYKSHYSISYVSKYKFIYYLDPNATEELNGEAQPLNGPNDSVPASNGKTQNNQQKDCFRPDKYLIEIRNHRIENTEKRIRLSAKFWAQFSRSMIK